MHHKRRRPKNRRAGCLLCYPHKGNGCNKLCNQPARFKRARVDEQEGRDQAALWQQSRQR